MNMTTALIIESVFLVVVIIAFTKFIDRMAYVCKEYGNFILHINRHVGDLECKVKSLEEEVRTAYTRIQALEGDGK